MNENQEVVLNQLKTEHDIAYSYPFSCVEKVIIENWKAYINLTRKEQFEILAEFAKWGLKLEN